MLIAAPVSILVVSGDNNLEDNRIKSQANYPILLTCPHGTVKVSPARKKSNLPSSCDPDQFTKDSDLFTLELTQMTALNLYRLGGRDVYTNIALVHRRFVDFNRDPECAFELSTDYLAQHLYDEYNNTGIKKIIKKMHNQSNQGLCFLFDIHGTGETDADIYFGTDSTNPTGSTICGLLERNPNALWDDNGIVKLLQESGYSTIPSTVNDPELPSLDGGTTEDAVSTKEWKQFSVRLVTNYERMMLNVKSLRKIWQNAF